MRYRPDHKAEVHQKIVKDASQRVRAEGLNGAAVAAVMRDTGLTHPKSKSQGDSHDAALNVHPTPPSIDFLGERAEMIAEHHSKKEAAIAKGLLTEANLFPLDLPRRMRNALS